MALKEGTKTQDTEAKEIRQEIKMTVDERQKMAKKIKQEYYGKRLPDIRDY
jgi:ubiquinone biosynthesis protein COQ9